MKTRTILITGGLVAAFVWASEDREAPVKTTTPAPKPAAAATTMPAKTPRIPFSDPSNGIYAPLYIVDWGNHLKARADDYSPDKAYLQSGSCVFPYTSQPAQAGFMQIMFFDQNNRSQSGYFPTGYLKPADRNKVTENTCRAILR